MSHLFLHAHDHICRLFCPKGTRVFPCVAILIYFAVFQPLDLRSLRIYPRGYIRRNLSTEIAPPCPLQKSIQVKDASLLFVYLEPHDCFIMKHEAKHRVNMMFKFSLKWCYKAIVILAVEKNLSFLLFSTFSSLYAVSNTTVSSLPAGLVRSSIPLLLEQILFQCSSSPTQHNPLPRPTAELFQYFFTPLLSPSVLIHFLLFLLSTFFLSTAMSSVRLFSTFTSSLSNLQIYFTQNLPYDSQYPSQLNLVSDLLACTFLHSNLYPDCGCMRIGKLLSPF